MRQGPRRYAMGLPLFGVAMLLAGAARAATTADLPPPDLTPWSMVQNADIVVQAVIAGLAWASLVTWTVALAKGLELLAVGRRARTGLAALRQAGSLGEAASKAGLSGVCGEVVRVALREAEASAGLAKDGVKERAAWSLERVVARSGRVLQRGTGVLATIGATAPFVGLFGTVWGIMHAFVGIARSQTTNLAVVAPGIAEALLATAVGLVAAIPAVVIYNLFARATSGQRARLADAVAEVMRLLSRDLDRAEGRGGPGRLMAAE